VGRAQARPGTWKSWYGYFPQKLKSAEARSQATTRAASSRLTALWARVRRSGHDLLDEPSTGLAPQIVEEIFEIVKASIKGAGELF